MSTTEQELPDAIVMAIAREAHEMNRLIQVADRDPAPSPPWEELSESQQLAEGAAVRAMIAAGLVPADKEWERWAKDKLDSGWTWGPVKDPVARTHPCLVGSYAELPLMQQLKDYARLGVVFSMFSSYREGK